MNMINHDYPSIRNLTAEDERRIRRIPLLNIDTFIIPSPYITDATLEKDYNLSFVWEEEGELLGYILVYSNQTEKQYHVYRQSTSPFSRGKGIGSAFMDVLSSTIPSDSLVYLYVWEKQLDSINFFKRVGFTVGESLPYRKLVFFYMSANAETLRKAVKTMREKEHKGREELGKLRHDAGKNAKLIFDMVNMLSADNYNKVIEDINRETTALINMLNSYRDTLEYIHEIDLEDLILERLVPFIKASPVPCRINFSIRNGGTEIMANYVEVGRALINLLSNSLEAIKEARRNGEINISLADNDGHMIMEFYDNGTGIAPELMELNSESIPKFVGQTTKKGEGSGIGTKQIFTAFGKENIKIESEYGEYTKWIIAIPKSIQGEALPGAALEAKCSEIMETSELPDPGLFKENEEVIRFIWRMRRMELFCYELILQFSTYNNIREIYRSILHYLYGTGSVRSLKLFLQQKRIEKENIKVMLLNTVQKLKRNMSFLHRHSNAERFLGTLLGSYGLAVDVTIIFTLNPLSGKFLATDRKLAEHLDFVQYLGGARDELLRGEFCGDIKDIDSPIYLGVWNISNKEDLIEKMKLIRMGAEKLIEMGIIPQKKLAFYHTTYNTSNIDVNTYKTTTLQLFAALPDDELMSFTDQEDEEMQGMLLLD